MNAMARMGREYRRLSCVPWVIRATRAMHHQRLQILSDTKTGASRHNQHRTQSTRMPNTKRFSLLLYRRTAPRTA